MPAADHAKVQLIQDRRRLLEHALHVSRDQLRANTTPAVLSMCQTHVPTQRPLLQVFKCQGGRLQLPIGMASAEPWLLDSVDVEALLAALLSAGGSKAPALELLSYCQKGTRCSTRTTDLV